MSRGWGRPTRFNGAALFRARRCYLAVALLSQAVHASTEPRSFERGDKRTPSAFIKSGSLQRSRALSSAEIVPGALRVDCQLVASTEPRSFERGDSENWDLVPGWFPASTEPRSFERGDSAKDLKAIAAATPLQRSRALSSAEMPTQHWHVFRHFPLQRSRALSSAEISARRPHHAHPYQLQRSRALSSAEISEPTWFTSPFVNRFNGAALFRARRLMDWVERLMDAIASTEPRSFERGDSFTRAAAIAGPLALQRSRALSSAEMISESRSPSSAPSLQRSRALSSAEIERQARNALPSALLQRSRALSSAEMPRSVHPQGG